MSNAAPLGVESRTSARYPNIEQNSASDRTAPSPGRGQRTPRSGAARRDGPKRIDFARHVQRESRERASGLQRWRARGGRRVGVGRPVSPAAACWRSSGWRRQSGQAVPGALPRCAERSQARATLRSGHSARSWARPDHCSPGSTTPRWPGAHASAGLTARGSPSGSSRTSSTTSTRRQACASDGRGSQRRTSRPMSPGTTGTAWGSGGCSMCSTGTESAAP